MDSSRAANCQHHFYPLSLRRATPNPSGGDPERQFLSTLSLRRATALIHSSIHSSDILSTLSFAGELSWFGNLSIFNDILNFYPRSPCGERRIHYDNYNLPFCTISIHALLAESDREVTGLTCGDGQFLSTLSLRRATQTKTNTKTNQGDFYPRSPCGERPL